MVFLMCQHTSGRAVGITIYLLGWLRRFDSEPQQSAQGHVSRKTRMHTLVPVWPFIYSHLFNPLFGDVFSFRLSRGSWMRTSVCAYLSLVLIVTRS